MIQVVNFLTDCPLIELQNISFLGIPSSSEDKKPIGCNENFFFI